MKSRSSLVSAVTFFTAFCTVLLLCAGALVTSTGSGLAVPDWPLSYGQFFPPMVGGVLYEHGHRLVAGFVALLTIFQAIFLTRVEPRRWVVRLGWLAVGIVLLQATLGGITVLFRLPKMVSIGHACLAQLFFCTTVVIAVVTSPSWFVPLAAPKEESAFPIRWLGVLTCVAFFFQLLMGATMRHFGAGLAIPDFPQSFGHWVPPLLSFPVTIHFAHRVGALLVTILVVSLVYRVYQRYWNRFTLLLYAGAVMGLVWMQLMVGAMVIWLRRPVPVTMIHLAVGALCFASCVALTLQLFRAHREAVTEIPLGVGWSPA